MSIVFDCKDIIIIIYYTALSGCPGTIFDPDTNDCSCEL